jgi:hypothetical protein
MADAGGANCPVVDVLSPTSLNVRWELSAASIAEALGQAVGEETLSCFQLVASPPLPPRFERRARLTGYAAEAAEAGCARSAAEGAGVAGGGEGRQPVALRYYRPSGQQVHSPLPLFSSSSLLLVPSAPLPQPNGSRMDFQRLPNGSPMALQRLSGRCWTSSRAWPTRSWRACGP